MTFHPASLQRAAMWSAVRSWALFWQKTLRIACQQVTGIRREYIVNLHSPWGRRYTAYRSPDRSLRSKAREPHEEQNQGWHHLFRRSGHGRHMRLDCREVAASSWHLLPCVARLGFWPRTCRTSHAWFVLSRIWSHSWQAEAWESHALFELHISYRESSSI